MLMRAGQVCCLLQACHMTLFKKSDSFFGTFCQNRAKYSLFLLFFLFHSFNHSFFLARQVHFQIEMLLSSKMFSTCIYGGFHRTGKNMEKSCPKLWANTMPNILRILSVFFLRNTLYITLKLHEQFQQNPPTIL